VKLDDFINEYYGISKLPENPVYAMAYIPFQQEESKVYSPDQGLISGTMFPELDKPFYGKKCGEAK